MKTRILVTGHEGFIGHNMTSWLNQQGYIVKGWHWNPGDFPDVNHYDWVIHLGAITDVHEKDVDLVMRQNLEFSQQLFKECNKAGTHLQYASSSAVYGNTKNFSEDAPCYPQSPYAWSKYLFDRWVFQQDLKVMVQGFRYFDVYGKWMHLQGNQANFIYNCRRQAKQQGYIEIWKGAEHSRRDWVWVGDVCKLHTTFIESVVGSGIWNVGSGLPHSFLDIAEAVAEQEGVPIREIPSPEEERSQLRLSNCANLKHLKETVGKLQWLNVYEWLDSE